MVTVEDISENTEDTVSGESDKNDDGGAAHVSSRRRRVVSSKLKGYVVDNPGGSCPGCTLYVKPTDDGIVCTGCVRYWHYACAGVDAESVRELGKNSYGYNCMIYFKL